VRVGAGEMAVERAVGAFGGFEEEGQGGGLEALCGRGDEGGEGGSGHGGVDFGQVFEAEGGRGVHG
jgi:hypothetical protein